MWSVEGVSEMFCCHWMCVWRYLELAMLLPGTFAIHAKTCQNGYAYSQSLFYSFINNSATLLLYLCPWYQMPITQARSTNGPFWKGSQALRSWNPEGKFISVDQIPNKIIIVCEVSVTATQSHVSDIPHEFVSNRFQCRCSTVSIIIKRTVNLEGKPGPKGRGKGLRARREEE